MRATVKSYEILIRSPFALHQVLGWFLLLGILILTLCAWPYSVEAQRDRLYRVGVLLLGGPHSSTIDGLRDGLRELGLEEGKQFVLHIRDTKAM